MENETKSKEIENWQEMFDLNSDKKNEYLENLSFVGGTVIGLQQNLNYKERKKEFDDLVKSRFEYRPNQNQIARVLDNSLWMDYAVEAMMMITNGESFDKIKKYCSESAKDFCKQNENNEELNKFKRIGKLKHYTEEEIESNILYFLLRFTEKGPDFLASQYPEYLDTEKWKDKYPNLEPKDWSVLYNETVNENAGNQPGNNE